MPDSRTTFQTQAPDFRVIELSKSSQTDSLRRKLSAVDTNSYICLGHFDCLCVKKLDAGFPLEAIEQDFQQRDNYNYPLYIFHYPSTSFKELEHFWNMKACFMTVSRVHFSPSAEADVQLLKKALTSLHQGGPEPEGPGEQTIRIGGELIRAVFYHTLELGDLVVILKSNSLPACLDAIRRIMEVAQVGDVYSFCGIHFDLIKSNVKQAAKDWDQHIGHHFFQLSAGDSIKQPLPHASMRFSISSIRCAEKFWGIMNRQPFFIVGTADAIIDFSQEPISSLIQAVFCLAFREFSTGPDNERVTMYDAFEDIITRVGSQYGPSYSEALSLKPRKLPPTLERTQKTLISKARKFMEKQTRWGPVLNAQANTLSAMMGSCVTDDLSMLIWPSARALMSRLSYLFETEQPIGQKQETQISQFLDGWNILENDVSRIEGQLSQNPELLSSRYYIPATLLAFYMALLHECNMLLLEINRDGDQGYVPLITYNTNPRAQTRCILDPSADEQAKDVYKGDTPLLVSLPVTMMFQPLEAAIVLCHELSHYSGTATRQRQQRYKHILSSCAGRIAQAWMLDGRPEYQLVQGGHNEILRELVHRLDRLYSERYPFNKDYYMDQLIEALPNIITQIFYDQRFQSGLMQRYFGAEMMQRYVLEYSKEFNSRKQYRTLIQIRGRINNLLLLYRECYADLMAILALDLKTDDYLLYMFYREAQYIKGIAIDNEAEQLRELQIQAALVLSATGQKPLASLEPAQTSSADHIEWLTEWKRGIGYYQRGFETRKDIFDVDRSDNVVMLPAEYLPLITYLTNCRKAIVEELKKEEIKSRQKNLLKILDAVKDGFDLEQVHAAITKYRNILLA